MTGTQAKQATLLGSRGVIRLEGPDARTFLQGIVTNDVTRAGPERALWSAFLTPQGKFLHEFFLVQEDGALLLDCERGRLADLLRRLVLYRLRSKAELADASQELQVAAFHGAGALEALGLGPEPGAARRVAGGIVYTDPRLAGLGARAVLAPGGFEQLAAAGGFAAGSLAVYDRLRIGLGVPDGSRDLEVERAILLENGFDELHGVDWQKGCFLGQELTARTKYRALIKKRLVPVAIAGPAPEPGAAIELDGREVGTLRSVAGDVGLATLRLEALDSGVLRAGAAELTPRVPDWMVLPAAETPE